MILIKLIKFNIMFIKRYYLSLTFFALLIGGIFSIAYSHELVHQVIYDTYGIDSEIIWFYEGDNWWEFSIATQSEPHPPDQCPESCHLAHNINEAISYVLLPSIIILGFGIWVLIRILESIKNKIDDLSEDESNEAD